MSTDRHDPLDADERELARVLRALPAGEPPSALDARILAMARDAVVSTPTQKDEGQPRGRRAPRRAWGLGVAACCVFAAGLAWRMGGFGTESFDLVGTDQRAERASAPASAEPMAQPAAPAPAALPASEASAGAMQSVPAERSREQATMRATPLPDEAHVVAEDSQAGPLAWLQHIRARIELGDTEGARQSLEGFIERYPREPLPQDLIDFGDAAGIDRPRRDDE